VGFFKKILGFLKESKEAPKLGRNEECWCGSGKKYKKCHMEADNRKKSKI
jgi:uncharacterized protein YecA (UPF0149 family)